MNATKALMIALLATGQMAVAAEQDDNNAELQSYYNQQCGHLADEQKIQGEDRDQFMQNCLADAPDVWPVGLVKDEA